MLPTKPNFADMRVMHHHCMTSDLVRTPILAVLLIISLAITVVCRSTFAQASQDSQSATTHINQGIASMSAGDMEKALAEFKEASHLEPKSSKPFVWIGVTENQLGHFQEAAAAFQSALNLDPTSQAAHYNLALSLIRLHKNPAAIHELEEVVKADPSIVDAQYNLAVLLEDEGHYAEAVPHLEIAEHERPQDAGIAVRLIESYIKTNRKQQALRLANQIDLSGLTNDTAMTLGSLLLENGEFESAIRVLTAAHSESTGSLPRSILLARANIGAGRPADAIDLLLPLRDVDTSGEAAYTLGLAYLSLNQSDHAEKSFSTAARLNPENAAAHFHLGLVLLQLSPDPDHSEGGEELAKAVALSPHEGPYYVALGSWLLENNRPSDALSLLKHAMENASPTAELYLLMGIAEASVNGTKSAQPLIEKAITLDPRIALAHNILGYCYFVSGDNARALQSYKKATDLDPNQGRFAYDVALLLDKMQRPTDALPYAQKAAALRSSNAAYHYLLGKLYSELDRNVDAIQELEASVHFNPDLGASHYLLARTYKRIGDTGKAREEFTKVEKLKQASDKPATDGDSRSDADKSLSPALTLTKPQSEPEGSALPH
jgi:tetratricopeptide (TPR) repeat protein